MDTTIAELRAKIEELKRVAEETDRIERKLYDELAATPEAKAVEAVARESDEAWELVFEVERELEDVLYDENRMQAN